MIPELYHMQQVSVVFWPCLVSQKRTIYLVSRNQTAYWPGLYHFRASNCSAKMKSLSKNRFLLIEDYKFW